MRQVLEQLDELKDDGIDYVRLRWASVRLAAVDKLATLVSKAFGRIVFLLLLLIAIAFFMIAGAIWLGEVLGHESLGFLVAGGVILVAGIIFLFAGGRLIINTLVRHFIDIFFPENDDDHDTQE
jgi:hypothetical protein